MDPTVAINLNGCFESRSCRNITTSWCSAHLNLPRWFRWELLHPADVEGMICWKRCFSLLERENGCHGSFDGLMMVHDGLMMVHHVSSWFTFLGLEGVSGSDRFPSNYGLPSRNCQRLDRSIGSIFRYPWLQRHSTAQCHMCGHWHQPKGRPQWRQRWWGGAPGLTPGSFMDQLRVPPTFCQNIGGQVGFPLKSLFFGFFSGASFSCRDWQANRWKKISPVQDSRCHGNCRARRGRVDSLAFYKSIALSLLWMVMCFVQFLNIWGLFLQFIDPPKKKKRDGTDASLIIHDPFWFVFFGW